jgi:spore germination cell wall hydrolase CwlJ-like protein
MQTGKGPLAALDGRRPAQGPDTADSNEFMGHYLRGAAIAAAVMALTAGHPVSADTTAELQAVPQSAMDIATSPASNAAAALQPAVATVESLNTLEAKVAATDADVAATDDQLRCLATAIYFEARSEPLEGQLAVAQVVRNRTRSGRFPASLCGVVYQPSQFSFSHRRSPSNREQWARAVKVATIAMSDGWHQVVPDALYFHAARVSPGWNAHRVARIGNNIFYR